MNKTPSKLRLKRLQRIHQARKEQIYTQLDQERLHNTSYEDIWFFFPDMTEDEALHMFRQYRFGRWMRERLWRWLLVIMIVAVVIAISMMR